MTTVFAHDNQRASDSRGGHDSGMDFVLRTVAAAEERLRAFGAGRADAMVFAPNELGQQLWRAHGYQPQQDWRRWVKPL